MKYKRYRNKFDNLKRVAKKQYFQHQLGNAKNNMKQTWSIINQLIGKTTQTENLPTQFVWVIKW